MQQQNPSASVSVESYATQFFSKYLRNGYGTTEEENLQVAGRNLLVLLQKLLAAGERSDVGIPLRVLRDVITQTYKETPRSVRRAKDPVEKLFQLFDQLEIEAQSVARPGQQDVVMEELRLRIYKLVVGDTWETLPELRMMALRRFYNYVQKEERIASRAMSQGFGSSGQAHQAQAPGSTTDKLMKAAMARIPHKILPPTATSWRAAFAELTKASGVKLVPLLKDLLGVLNHAETQCREYEQLMSTHQLVPKGSTSTIDVVKPAAPTPGPSATAVTAVEVEPLVKPSAPPAPAPALAPPLSTTVAPSLNFPAPVPAAITPGSTFIDFSKLPQEGFGESTQTAQYPGPKFANPFDESPRETQAQAQDPFAVTSRLYPAPLTATSVAQQQWQTFEDTPSLPPYTYTGGADAFPPPPQAQAAFQEPELKRNSPVPPNLQPMNPLAKLGPVAGIYNKYQEEQKKKQDDKFADLLRDLKFV